MRTAREKPPRPLLTIFVINKSLFDCPTPAPLPLIPFTVMVKIPVRGCVTADVIPMARTEAARGSWGFDLAGDLPQKTRDSIVFDHLDVSGLERIVIGPKADLYQTRPFPLPFQMSRAAVRGKSALVVLQYAQLSTWLILLTDNGSGWTVTKTVAWGMS